MACEEDNPHFEQIRHPSGFRGLPFVDRGHSVAQYSTRQAQQITTTKLSVKRKWVCLLIEQELVWREVVGKKESEEGLAGRYTGVEHTQTYKSNITSKQRIMSTAMTIPELRWVIQTIIKCQWWGSDDLKRGSDKSGAPRTPCQCLQRSLTHRFNKPCGLKWVSIYAEGLWLSCMLQPGAPCFISGNVKISSDNLPLSSKTKKQLGDVQPVSGGRFLSLYLPYTAVSWREAAVQLNGTLVATQWEVNHFTNVWKHQNPAKTAMTTTAMTVISCSACSNLDVVMASREDWNQ